MEPNGSPDVKPDPLPAAAIAPDGTLDWDTSAPKSFLKSRTFWILVCGLLVSPVLRLLGVAFDESSQQMAADLLVQIVTAAGALWSRSQATGPLTFRFSKPTIQANE